MEKTIALPRQKRVSGMGAYQKRRALYLMAIPGIIYYVVFRYIPMFGVAIAFQDYNPFGGVSSFWTSPFVGFQWFALLFRQPKFVQLLVNSLVLGLYGILFGFTGPIILALLVNEVRNRTFKKVTQTVTYIPHFLSWAVVGSIVIEILSPNGGIVNAIMSRFGLPATYFVLDKHLVRGVVVAAGVWKSVGWDSILYLAAIAGIDVALYEAATVDGAGRLRQTLHVTLPCMLPVIMVCLILAVGRVLDTSFDQIFMFYSPKVEDVLDVFDTYSYRVGIGNAQFSYVTALGLFRNVVGLGLVLGANRLSRLVSEHGLW